VGWTSASSRRRSRQARTSWARGSSDVPSWLLGRVWSCGMLACAISTYPRATQRLSSISLAGFHVQCVLHSALLSLLTRQRHFPSRHLHRWRRSRVAGDGRGRLHGRRLGGGARGEESSASGAERHQRCRGFGCPVVSSAAMTAFLGAATNLAGPLRPQS
jgi:hypothetical protein